MSEQPSIHRFPWYGLTSTVLMLAALTGADVLALDAPPADVSAKWWGEDWGTVSTSARELRPGDTFTVSATTLEGGIGEPRWLWVDSQNYLATGTKSVRIGWNSLGDALELVSYTSGPTNTEVIEGPNSVRWTAPPPHSAPGGPNPGDPPPPEAPPPRFGMGTTFSVTLKVRDPNEPNFPDGAWEAWKNVHANFTGNVGYTGWTDAALTYVALKGGASLKAELIADPEQVALDEPFQLKLRLTNNGQFELTNIKPVMDNDNKPRIVPADSVEIVSGPDPASISTLAPGMSSTILYECTMTEEGTVELSLGAEATCSEPDQPDPVTPDGTPTATVEGADVIKLNSASVDPSEKQIVPGDRVEFTFNFNKKHEDEVKLVLSPQQFFEPVNADAIQRENLLGEWVPMPDGVVPADVTGQFNVKAEVRVADETHQQIYTKVVRYYPGKIDLTNHRFFDAEFRINGEQRSLELFATINKAIEFPDYLGDDALPTSDPPPSAEELDYYIHGSTDANMAEATGDDVVPYYQSTYVRYVALEAIRGEGDDAETPDEADVAVTNLVNYLATRIPSRQDGVVWPVTTTSSWLKNDAQLPEMTSIGQAHILGAFARTIGLPAREMDVSLRHVAGIFSTDYHWAQHAASQIWYDGAWHWFDLYYDDRNGNAPVTDTGYPGFYFRNGSLFCSYREMKAFYAAKQLNKTMYGLKDDGNHFSGEPELYGDVWHLYDSCTREQAENADSRRMHITTHSPVTTLYIDAQGRRLGAAMGLNSQDMRPIAETDDIEPVRGGGSVWEVPGGIYIAPGTPLMRGENPDDWILLEEQIIVPFDELTDSFKLIVTGRGEGDYRVQVWIDDGAGSFDLYNYEGTITEGATEELDFGSDLSDAKPMIVSGPNGPGPNPNAKEPTDGTGQDTPQAGGCCGSAAPAMFLLTCYLMAGMKRRRRLEREQDTPTT